MTGSMGCPKLIRQESVYDPACVRTHPLSLNRGKPPETESRQSPEDGLLKGGGVSRDGLYMYLGFSTQTSIEILW